jgi:hypothetical protein
MVYGNETLGKKCYDIDLTSDKDDRVPALLLGMYVYILVVWNSFCIQKIPKLGDHGCRILDY